MSVPRPLLVRQLPWARGRVAKTRPCWARAWGPKRIVGAHPRVRQPDRPSQWAALKPERGFRVFILGGSSAYGFPWGAEQSFSRPLEDALVDALPDRDVEVINAAAMSYGSHRLRVLVRELLHYEPDLFVLYSGHNEFVDVGHK